MLDGETNLVIRHCKMQIWKPEAVVAGRCITSLVRRVWYCGSQKHLNLFQLGCFYKCFVQTVSIKSSWLVFDPCLIAILPLSQPDISNDAAFLADITSSDPLPAGPDRQ